MFNIESLPKKYLEFIEKNKRIKLRKNVTYECHHILPKSLGGNNLKDNLCYLTVKNHFLAHWLLAKETNNPKCWEIVFLMINTRKTNIPKIAYKIYEKIRENSRISLSITMKERWKNEEYQNFIKNMASEAWKKESYKENRKEKMKKYYEDPNYRANLSNKMKDKWKNDETFRNKCIKNLERTPERIEKCRKKLIKTLSTPEARELKRKISRALAKDPEHRKKISEGLKRSYKNRKKKNEESTD